MLYDVTLATLPFNVLGHSNGAAIALAYAEQFSSHCKKAVLIETDVIGFEEPKGQFMNELEKRKDDPRYAEAVKAFKRYSEEPPTSDEELTERIQSILSLYFVEPKSGVAEFAKDTGPLTVQIWAKTWQNKANRLPEAALIDSLGKVTGSVLLISGQDDMFCPPEVSKAALQGIGANAKHIIYPNCGHMPWIESKDEFFRDVMRFLLE